MIGLGHGGPYNGSVNPATQQYSAYDSRLWTVMSYLVPGDPRARYAGQDGITGTSWATRYTPTTPMIVDILAAQQLYGAPVTTPFSGGQRFGFNTNIAGPTARYYDFSVNTVPVVTIWDRGTGNTLDLSGYTQDSTVNLNPGSFSSVAGLSNNVAIAFGTAIDSAVGGPGNDTFFLNGNDDRIDGNLGYDTVVLPGARSEYTVRALGHAVVVQDTVLTRGGTNLLVNVEAIRFADMGVAAGGIVTSPRDFNGDGLADHLWQNTDGVVAEWTTGGGTGIVGGGGGWTVAGSGDFDGDGNADLLWRDASGTVVEWSMRDRAVLSSGGIGGDGTWSVVTTGDFNGDGKTDIVWRNGATGQCQLWDMDGRATIAAGNLGGDLDWSIVGSGDFNGDGHADLLWRNTNGTVVEWLMNDRAVIDAGTIGTDPSWRFVAAADFNRDGRSDILWRNEFSGVVQEWDMSGLTVQSSGALGGDLGWSVSRAEDVTGDGAADLFWRQASSGAVVEWDMSDRTVTGAHAIGGDLGWRLV